MEKMIGFKEKSLCTMLFCNESYFAINFFLQPFHFTSNIYHPTKILVEYGQLAEYINISSPICQNDNKRSSCLHQFLSNSDFPFLHNKKNLLSGKIFFVSVFSYR